VSGPEFTAIGAPAKATRPYSPMFSDVLTHPVIRSAVLSESSGALHFAVRTIWQAVLAELVTAKNRQTLSGGSRDGEP
jgi:hypothetical protein